VYSLGVNLYELLAGRLPFEGDVLLMISRVLLEEPPPPSKFRPDLDPELEAICLKAMAKKPEQRYASMAAFAGALQDYLRGKGTATEPALPAPIPTADAVVLEAPAGPAGDAGGPRSGARKRGGPPARKTAPPPTEVTPSPRARRQARRRAAVPVWGWVAGGAGVALAVLLVAAFVLWRVTNYGTVRLVQADPEARAELTIDGEAHPWGEPLRLRPGQHELEATAPGYQTTRQTFTVHRGDGQSVRVRLDREQAATVRPGDGAAAMAPLRHPAGPGELKVGEVRTTRWEGGPRIFSTAFSPDGRYYLAAGDKDVVRVWDVRTGEQVGQDIPGGYLAAFTPDGLVLTGAWARSRFSLHEPATGRFVRGFGDGGDLHNFTLSPDGNRLLAANPDGLRLWDVKAGAPLWQWKCDPKTSHSLFGPDGRSVLLREGDKPTWTIYDIVQRDFVAPRTPIVRVKDLRGFLPAAQTFVMARGGGGPGRPGAGRFQPAAQAYAVETTATHDVVQTYDVATGNKLRFAKWEKPGLDAVAWTADARRMVAALKDHQVLVYDMAARPEPKYLLPPRAEKDVKRVLRGAISLSPDGRYACWGGDPGYVKLWRLPP
jgi:hypothetical protein